MTLDKLRLIILIFKMADCRFVVNIACFSLFLVSTKIFVNKNIKNYFLTNNMGYIYLEHLFMHCTLMTNFEKLTNFCQIFKFWPNFCSNF